MGTEIAAVDRGLGHHAWQLSPSQRTAALRLNAVGQSFCIMSLTFCKFTVVLTFQRAIEGAGRRFAIVYLWCNGVAAFVINIVTVAVMFADCTPMEKNYNQRLPGTCLSPKILAHISLAQGCASNLLLSYISWFLMLTRILAVSAVTDFLLSIFPTATLYKLQMSFRTKITLIFLMSLGCITGVFAVVRTVYTGPYNQQGDSPCNLALRHNNCTFRG